MSEYRLKPCPFCGSTARLKRDSGKGNFKVVCDNDNCTASYIYGWSESEEAAAKSGTAE